MGISKALMEKVAVASSRNSTKTIVCLTRYGKKEALEVHYSFVY